MKKLALIIIIATYSLSIFAQRIERLTNLDYNQFKRHFSYSIEGGYVDNLPRVFIAGNQSDYLLYNTGARQLQGNTIDGTTILGGRYSAFYPNQGDDKILLTDFVIPGQGGDVRYGYGTGIYYPYGETSMGYPFFGTYDRKTMQLINVVYYNLSYPGVSGPRNAGGTRIKYSAKENAFYISGVMVDRVFVDMNFNEIQGASKGFIIKVDPLVLSAQVIVFDPDPLPEGRARICSVNDMEINAEENAIYFTGVTAEDKFAGYIHPMVGMIDMDLTQIWCNVYEMSGPRFSGVDVELGNHESTLFVLMNSDNYPFSIMELDTRGNVIQQPEAYEFSIATCNEPMGIPIAGAARGHIMHYTETSGLKITGNVYIQDEHTLSQRLFAYTIPTASNLRSGYTYFGTYSCDPIPLGSQPAVTSWWAPENSLYSAGNLNIVGHCLFDEANLYHGYVYVNTAGFDTTSQDCYFEGVVRLKDLITHQLDHYSYLTSCSPVEFPIDNYPWFLVYFEDCSSIGEKSSFIEGKEDGKPFWKYAGIDETGIHGYINSDEETQFQINIYDLTGRKVYSENYLVKGEKYIHLKFNAGNQLYLINVSNGTQSETSKVSGVK